MILALFCLHFKLSISFYQDIISVAQSVAENQTSSRFFRTVKQVYSINLFYNGFYLSVWLAICVFICPSINLLFDLCRTVLNIPPMQIRMHAERL